MSEFQRLAAAMDAPEQEARRVDSELEEPAVLGAASVELRFSRDRDGRCIVAGRVRATLRLCCQRCLGEVEIPVDARIQLALIRRDEEALDLPEHLDPWLVTEERLVPLDMIEDELLLAVPVVPRHPVGSCTAGPVEHGEATASARNRETGSEARRGPFEILAALKQTPGK
ncbi:YceD family protein [Thiocapsa bogorovii]|uniref:YceD family protein n=1 Tax=Thiocapsa bogorovii TaxID=521689 RepID=UPI001E350836|nr:YceD family protein [Thiocapsa bogorovii]UHD16202.1 YceD family protein [Thiocapsa bogorovii]